MRSYTVGVMRRYAGVRCASTLVLASHDGKTLDAATLNAVTAATKIGNGSDVTLLVAGQGVEGVAQKAQTVAGVQKVCRARAGGARVVGGAPTVPNHDRFARHARARVFVRANSRLLVAQVLLADSPTLAHANAEANAALVADLVKKRR